MANAPKVASLVMVAVNDLAHLVLLIHHAPRFRGQPAQAQPDALALFVHVHHVDFDFLAHPHDLAGVLDAMPGQLGKMDQAVGSAQVDECAEIARCW